MKAIGDILQPMQVHFLKTCSVCTLRSCAYAYAIGAEGTLLYLSPPCTYTHPSSLPLSLSQTKQVQFGYEWNIHFWLGEETTQVGMWLGQYGVKGESRPNHRIPIFPEGSLLWQTL